MDQYLEKIKEIKEELRRIESLSGPAKEKVSEGNVLISKLPSELQNRKEYLEAHIDYRIEYENLRTQFFNWSHDAGSKLKLDESGIDFENIYACLDDHKVICMFVHVLVFLRVIL